MDLLHPQLLSKQQLLEIFRQRNFSIPRLEESTRDELIQLYAKHLLPQPRRGAPGSGPAAAPQDVEMKDDTGCNSSGDSSRKRNNLRQRIVYGESSAMDNVSQGVKKIRLINSSGTVGCGTNGTGNSSFTEQKRDSPAVTKRPLEISPGKSTAISSVTGNNPTSKRQKITWP